MVSGIPTKHKASKIPSGSNPIAQLSSMHTREWLDDVGGFFFSNGIPTLTAQSPYFVRMTSMVAKGGPSYLPSGGHKLRTTVLDRAYDRVGISTEHMNACWIKAATLSWMGGHALVVVHTLILW